MSEAWAPIAGYEGRYEVSDFGRVRSFVVSTRTGNKPGPHLMKLLTRKRDGYQTVGLVKDGVRRVTKVHQLVAHAFLPPRPSPKHDPDHENGNRADNRACNLRWLTKKQNSWNTNRVRSESGVLGVYKSEKGARPWRAVVMRHGRSVTVGTFWTIEEAKSARDNMAAKLEEAA